MRSVARYPMRVIAVVTDDITEGSLEEDVARWDDTFWSAYTRRPFSWQRFMTWWVARRWVIPRGKT